MSKARVDFKHKMLKLLKEDEEFRYAVVGLIGIEDIRSGQARLEQAYIRLEEAIAKLTEGQSRLEQAVGNLEQAVGRLAEAQAKTEIAIQELFRQVSILTVRFNELSMQVSRLSDTVGFGLEDIVKVVIPGWLYRHEGIVVDDLVRRFFIVDGKEVEVNLYGEGLREGVKVVVLGEVKSRIYEGDVKDFDKSMERLSSLFAAENIYKLMFGYYIHPSAEHEAEKRKITLIASYMR